jgi:eukaryotic-like serine/threonine-protein kinase
VGLRRTVRVVGAQLVMERFRLLERIGSGGMGTVYRAFDERLQRQVAVKQLSASDPDRVVREAQAAARLNHPAIVTLYELGEHDGHAVLVSELVPGETLAELERAGDLCDRDVGEIVADLCEALVHAHDRGVVHRDIKPENVIVREVGGIGRRAKLMDFGIARIAGAPTLTAHGEVVGTLAYMSPEQAEGELAGPPTDVYSLALTAYECWAGENPVAGETPAETARRIGEPVVPLRVSRPDLPEGLADTIDACLDPDPVMRPSPFELRDCVLAELGELDSVHALPASHEDSSARESSRPPMATSKLAVLAGGALVLALLAGPLAAPGLALVLAVLALPSLIIGATVAGLAVLAAPLLGAIGLGPAAAGIGAVATTPPARALLGVGAWAWLFGGALALGAGPTLGIPAAPHGWIYDASLAADAILRPLVSFDSILGAGVFALAAVGLGRLLEMRHPALALLAAMLWAAAVNAALSLVGDGSLAGRPIGVVATAAVAVALEFAVLRPRTDHADLAIAPGQPTHDPRARLAERLA